MKLNKDVVGWITIFDTHISYPVAKDTIFEYCRLYEQRIEMYLVNFPFQVLSF